MGSDREFVADAGPSIVEIEDGREHVGEHGLAGFCEAWVKAGSGQDIIALAGDLREPEGLAEPKGEAVEEVGLGLIARAAKQLEDGADAGPQMVFHRGAAIALDGKDDAVHPVPPAGRDGQEVSGRSFGGESVEAVLSDGLGELEGEAVEPFLEGEGEHVPAGVCIVGDLDGQGCIIDSREVSLGERVEGPVPLDVGDGKAGFFPRIIEEDGRAKPQALCELDCLLKTLPIGGLRWNQSCRT